MYIDVPHALGDVVGSWAGSGLGCVASSQVVPVLCLEVPDGSREEAGGDEVEEAGGEDEEHLQFGRSAAPK